MNTINNTFEKVYCINLDRATERWNKSCRQFKQHQIEVERVSGIEPKAGVNDLYAGEIGIMRTNYQLVKNAKENNYKNIFIFEDDFIVPPDFISKFNWYFDEVPDDWDFLYLGGWHFGDVVQITDNIAKVRRTFATHSFAIKNTMYDRILMDISKEKHPVDVYYADMMPTCNAYCITPNLSNQINGYSYIQNIVMNHDGWGRKS